MNLRNLLTKQYQHISDLLKALRVRSAEQRIAFDNEMNRLIDNNLVIQDNGRFRLA